jgi:hypothetical protein
MIHTALSGKSGCTVARDRRAMSTYPCYEVPTAPGNNCQAKNYIFLEGDQTCCGERLNEVFRKRW